MCILCVASRWSRRIVTMLPWLIIPLLLLWGLSQLLPPGFRFEVTSPRLACVAVLLFSLGWYELLMPRLSEWRARRSLLLHEKRKIEAQEAAKWRKEAIRKCRNCDSAYKDQKPIGGRFMCTYCGHVSKRPALDIPGGNSGSSSAAGAGAGAAGLGGFIFRKDLRNNKGLNQRVFHNELWPGLWSSGSSSDACIMGWQNSGVLIVFRLVSLVCYCVYWAASKLSRGSLGDGDRSRAERKGRQRRGEDQESKVEKLRRKAEEKRLARLEKEQMEAEERMQREEVARLVDERRKQRAEMMMMDAEKESAEQERKQNDKAKSRSSSTSNSQDDVKKDAKVRKDKRSETKASDTNPKAEEPAVKPCSTKVEEPVKAANRSFGSKMSTVLKPGTYALPKYQAKTRGGAVKPFKQDKVCSSTLTANKVNLVVQKPSAWNRISWAWGKRDVQNRNSDTTSLQESTTTTTTTTPPMVVPASEVDNAVQGQQAGAAPGAISPPKTSLPPSPTSRANPLFEPALQKSSYFGCISDSAVFTSSKPSSLSAFSAPFPSPTKVSQTTSSIETGSPFHFSTAGSDSCSVYSTYMAPPAAAAVPGAAVPGCDPWSGGDVVPKSTWQMWDAPNLELPRLTQALSTGRPAAAVTRTGTLVSAGALGLSTIWDSNALESTKKIWEELDFQSESTPPEFVDCITQEVMKDPVIAADGHSYERAAIEAWLRTHDTSPRTGEVLPLLGLSGGRVDKSLRPNHNLRGQIIEYRECLQRSVPKPPVNNINNNNTNTNNNNNSWEAEALKKCGGSGSGSGSGGLYTPPPGVRSVWAFNSS